MENSKRIYIETEIKALSEAIEKFEKAMPIIEKYVGKKVTKRIQTALEKEGIQLSVGKSWEWLSYFEITNYSSIHGSIKRKDFTEAIYPNYYRNCSLELNVDDEGKLVDMERPENCLKRYKEYLKELYITLDESHHEELVKKYEELKKLNNEFVDMLQGLDRKSHDKFDNIATMY